MDPNTVLDKGTLQWHRACTEVLGQRTTLNKEIDQMHEWRHGTWYPLCYVEYHILYGTFPIVGQYYVDSCEESKVHSIMKARQK